MKMCITEIWKYGECGCQYMYPTPCYDRVVESPVKTHKATVKSGSISYSSASSILSFERSDAVTEDSVSICTSSGHLSHSRSENEEDDDYNRHLHFARTCSLHRTIHRTFLEPICDDCLLLELGLVPESDSDHRRSNGSEYDERTLDGAEWLLESSVEIVVEPSADNDNDFQEQSQAGILNPSSEDEWEYEMHRRGRDSRRAMEISRDSLSMTQTSSPTKSSRRQRIKQTAQSLRRVRKRRSLKHWSSSESSRSVTSSQSPLSWIEHLKADLGHRVLKRKSNFWHAPDSNQQTESSNDESAASATEDDHMLSLPSIPATASSDFSASFAGGEHSLLVPLDQFITSSEFDASLLVRDPSSDVSPESMPPHPTEPDRDRPATSSSSSLNSFHTATSSILPSSSLNASLAAESGLGLSLHPLSCPLSLKASQQYHITGDKGQEIDGEDSRVSDTMEETDPQGVDRVQCMDELAGKESEPETKVP
jgi:hypothetical protein